MAKLHIDPKRLPVDAIAGEPALPADRLDAAWLRARLAHPPLWEPELPEDLRQRFPELRRAAVLIPIVRRPELEALIRSYFGERVNETKLRLADVPEGSQLVGGNAMSWPILTVENVYVLPGVPEFFRRTFDAIREQFRAAPFYVCMIFTLEDELEITTRLDELAATHKEVEIGSYPVFGGEEYLVKVTIESKERAAVEKARQALLARLKPEEIVRTEANYE